MGRPHNASRRLTFGLLSYIIPVAVALFIVLPTFWLVIAAGISRTLPARFAKLQEALDWIVYGLPILGMFVIALGGVAAIFWHLAH